jgi:hypothetical protein
MSENEPASHGMKPFRLPLARDSSHLFSHIESHIVLARSIVSLSLDNFQLLSFSGDPNSINIVPTLWAKLYGKGVSGPIFEWLRNLYADMV